MDMVNFGPSRPLLSHLIPLPSPAEDFLPNKSFMSFFCGCAPLTMCCLLEHGQLINSYTTDEIVPLPLATINHQYPTGSVRASWALPLSMLKS